MKLHENVPVRPTQGRLLAEALVLEASGMDQEEIAAMLEQRYPDMPFAACYLNPAAEAVMRHVRKEQRRLQAIEVDKIRLSAKGLPESLALRGRQPKEDDPTVREPSEAQLAAISRGSELMALCALYDLYFRIDPADGSLMLSRPILKDGALHRAIQPYRAGIVQKLKESHDHGT